MPDDGIQVVKADLPADDADVGVEGKYEMPAEIAPGHADISDYAYKASTGNKDAVNMLPDFFEFSKKPFIILDMPQLIGIFVITFKIPIRGRGNNEMNGFIFHEG